jgi:signal transduction histidine kinase
MIGLTLQLLCLFLVATGLLFVLIEVRSHFDRSFLLFGITLILLCCLPAIDLWRLPACKTPGEVLYWTRVYHVIAVLLMPFLLWYLGALTKSDLRVVGPIVALASAVLVVLFLTDHMLKVGKERPVAGLLYYVTLVPVAFAYLVGINWLIVSKLRSSAEAEKRILLYHLAGFVLLAVFGTMDLAVVSIIGMFTLPIPNFTILGILGFGLVASFVFTERFLQLIRDRQQAQDKLQAAYKEMEEATTLRQIGESTSIINHEIKNYMQIISGSAELIKLTEGLTDRGRERIEGILSAVSNLQGFSQDILQLSKARIIKDKKPIRIVSLIEQCRVNYFDDHKGQIAVESARPDVTVHGDWHKLEHVFMNLFKNSFEAEAKKIDVQVIVTDAIVLVSVVDDGTGCAPEQMGNMFKAFFTTKKGKQGTGLGMSICKAVIESHGGRVAAHTLNGLGADTHGLQINLAFPNFATDLPAAAPEKSPIVLIKNGIEDIGAVLRVFQNVSVSPFVLQSVGDLDRRKEGFEGMGIVTSAANLKELRARKSVKTEQITVIVCREGGTYVMSLAEGESPTVFSEDYVLTHLCVYGGDADARASAVSRAMRASSLAP